MPGHKLLLPTCDVVSGTTAVPDTPWLWFWRNQRTLSSPPPLSRFVSKRISSNRFTFIHGFLVLLHIPRSGCYSHIWTKTEPKLRTAKNANMTDWEKDDFISDWDKKYVSTNMKYGSSPYSKDLFCGFNSELAKAQPQLKSYSYAILVSIFFFFSSFFFFRYLCITLELLWADLARPRHVAPSGVPTSWANSLTISRPARSRKNQKRFFFASGRPSQSSSRTWVCRVVSPHVMV